MTDLHQLRERVREAAGRGDRDLDEDIAEALGGTVRRVGRLGLNGRTRGSWRVFWPGDDPCGPGKRIPYYTRTEQDRERAIRKLSALITQENEDG